MKAVLVLDEMPINCGECILEVRKMCTGRRKDIDEDLEKKPSWCPLKEMPYNYEDAFKVACELLNGDMTDGVDKYYIFEHMMKKNGVVSCKSYEEYILEHLDQLAMWRWEDEDETD